MSSVCLCVCLSVCLSRSCIVLRLQKISTRFLHSHAHDSLLSLPGRVQLKFCSHGPTPSSPNFAPKWPTPVDLSVGDIRWQKGAGWSGCMSPFAKLLWSLCCYLLVCCFVNVVINVFDTVLFVFVPSPNSVALCWNLHIRHWNKRFHHVLKRLNMFIDVFNIYAINTLYYERWM